MIRTVSFIQRRSDLNREQFRQYYETKHAPLALPKLSGLEHYVRNHVIREGGARAIAFDAISEFEYHDEAAFDAMLDMLEGPEGTILRADELHFMHKPGNSFFRAQRDRILGDARPAPGTASKAIVLLEAEPGAGPTPPAAEVRDLAVALSRLTRPHCVETDTPEDPTAIVTAPWGAAIHLWYSRSAGADTVFAALTERLHSQPGHCCLWMHEDGHRITQHQPGTSS